MKVKDVMTEDVILVDKDVELEYVLKLMKKHEITKIPVVEDKKLIGIITDNKIAFKLGSIRSRGVPASRLHASSVTENEKLVGVVTKADLLPFVNSNKKLKELMQKKLHTISPSDRVIHARRLMIDENVARLPVVDQRTLVGIISDTEIAFALASLKKSISLGKQKHALDELLVEDVMKTSTIWAEPDITASEAAKIMIKNNIGSLPLIDNNKIVGIITRTDLIKTIPN